MSSLLTHTKPLKCKTLGRSYKFINVSYPRIDELIGPHFESAFSSVLEWIRVIGLNLRLYMVVRTDPNHLIIRVLCVLLEGFCFRLLSFTVDMVFQALLLVFWRMLCVGWCNWEAPPILKQAQDRSCSMPGLPLHRSSVFH